MPTGTYGRVGLGMAQAYRDGVPDLMRRLGRSARGRVVCMK
jgi:hypothetical protein